jgi:hypothetical protein
VSGSEAVGVAYGAARGQDLGFQVVGDDVHFQHVVVRQVRLNA